MRATSTDWLTQSQRVYQRHSYEARPQSVPEWEMVHRRARSGGQTTPGFGKSTEAGKQSKRTRLNLFESYIERYMTLFFFRSRHSIVRVQGQATEKR